MQKPHNALDRYIAKKGLTREGFAEVLGASRGYPAYKEHVNNWATNLKRPNNATRREIAKATNGQVPVESWGNWARRTCKLVGGNRKRNKQ